MKKFQSFKIFGRKVGIANTTNREKEEFVSTATEPSLDLKPEHETQKRPLSPKSRLLSPLPTLVSEFIADNARKTLDSIKDDGGKREFISDLWDTLKSVRDGKKRPPLPSHSSTWDVIIFFADTTESTLSSLSDEEERECFIEHLTRLLTQSFQQETLL